MELLNILFGSNQLDEYRIIINENMVYAIGCDCHDVMNDTVVVKVYEKLGEYLKLKGLKNEDS